MRTAFASLAGVDGRDLARHQRAHLAGAGAEWFESALELSWTRDPFDRLLVARARMRGWKLATGDAALLERLPARERLEIWVLEWCRLWAARNLKSKTQNPKPEARR